MELLQAGVSQVNITPPVGMYLPGMERPDASHGLRDDLYATALAIRDSQTEAVVISLDVLMMHPDTVAWVRREASALTGIPPENIMVCATHCHSGPVTYANEKTQPMFRAYADNLAYVLVGLVRLAHDRLQPVRVGFGRGASDIGLNRRLTQPDGVTVIRANLEGPTDPEVGVMRVDTLDGQPLAVLVNYACHSVVLGNGSNVISADWPGAMRRVVQDVTGAKLLFIQGADADINPWPGEPCDKPEVVEKLGLAIGGEVIKTWTGIETQAGGAVRAAQRKVWLPLLPLSEYAGKKPEFVEMAESVGSMSYEQLMEWLDGFMPWKAELSGAGDETRAAMEMQAIRFGDISLVGAAAEIFVKTGLEVKKRSPFANTMFASYANGSLSYIPLPEEYARGGYEVNEAWLLYRLPAPIAPEGAGLVVQAAEELLQQVAQ